VAAPAGAAGAQALPKHSLLITEVNLISNSQHVVQGQDPQWLEEKLDLKLFISPTNAQKLY
jgi:hypothetical protein